MTQRKVGFAVMANGMKAGLAVALLLVSSSVALAQKPDTPDKAVAQCVSMVRSTKLDKDEEKFFANAFRNFDAYYNPSTKKVYSNTAYPRAYFIFGKCLTELGFPLGD
jgi:hypothetical protein